MAIYSVKECLHTVICALDATSTEIYILAAQTS